jgi:hypothetical protein
MAIPDPVVRFRFDFDDLKRAPVPDLRVLAPELEPTPASAALVLTPRRPRWLPTLLPAFRSCEPLRVAVLDAHATAWAARLRTSLAALFSSAGAQAGLCVWEWQMGFAVGAPGFDRVPPKPHAVVVAAECDAMSIEAAVQLIGSADGGLCFLALHGDEPRLDRRIGIGAALAGRAHVMRFPLLRAADLSGLARGQTPALSKGAFGRACLVLAQALVAHYRESEP